MAAVGWFSYPGGVGVKASAWFSAYSGLDVEGWLHYSLIPGAADGGTSLPSSPPMLRAMVGILAAWQLAAAPLPATAYQPPPKVASFTVPDNPPFGQRTDNLPSLASILRAWEPPPAPAQPRPRVVPPPPVAPDNPPFGKPYPISTIVTAWSSRPVGWSSGPEVAAPDNPPFGKPYPISTIVRAWKTRPVGWSSGGQPDAAAPPSDNPPFGFRYPNAIVATAWSTRPVGWTGGSAPRPDDPPFGAMRWQQTLAARWHVKTWTPLWASVLVPTAPPVIDDPPFGYNYPIHAIVAAWKSRPVGWSGAGQEEPQAHDLPPFGGRPWQQTVVARWHHQKWTPLWSYVLVSPPADPPFGMPPGSLPTVLVAWRTPDPLPTLPRHVVQTGATPENPPFGIRPWLHTALAAWRVPDPLPTLPRHLVFPGDLPVDPPFSWKPVWLERVLRSWNSPDPPMVLPTLPRYLVQGGAAPENPPFGQRPWLSTVILAWQPPPPLPTLPLWTPRNRFIWLTDEPPYGQRLWLPRVLVAWQPTVPLPTLPRHVVFPGAAPENPPFGRRGFDGLYSVRTWWEPPVPQPRRILTIIQATDAPFGGYLFMTEDRGTGVTIMTRVRDFPVPPGRALIVPERTEEDV